MANTVSFVYVLKDKFSRVGRHIGDTTDRLRNKFKGLGDTLKESGRRVNHGSGLIAGGFKRMIAAAAGFFALKNFVDIGAKFQDSLMDLSAITGAAGKDLQFLSDESLRLAKSSRTAQDEVATAFKIVASAKSELLKDPKGLSKVTEQVLLLKNATGMDLASAAKVATESLNQFNAGADQAGRFVNVLAAGSKIGASEVNETGVAVVKSGVAARAAGLSFEQLNGAIQVLAKSGIKAEVAGTGLKTTLLKLETSGIKRITPSVVGFSAALDNLAKMHLTTKKMKMLFGEEAYNVGSILIENRKLVGDWTKEITGTNIANEQAAARMSTFNSKLKGMWIIIKDKLIKMFLRLEPIISKNVERFGAWIDGLDDSRVTAFADTLAKIASVASTVAGWFGEIFSLLDKIGTKMGEVAAQVSLGEWGNLSQQVFKASDSIVGTGKDIGVDLYNSALSTFQSIGNLFGGEDKKGLAGKINPQGQSSKTDVNVNLRAPANAIESIKSKTSGHVSGLNVGVNMATAQ